MAALGAACAAPRRIDAVAPPAAERRSERADNGSTGADAAPTIPPIRPLMSFTPGPVPLDALPPPTAADAAYLERAQQQLQASYQYTGLSDVQIAQQKNAEALLVAGYGQRAHAALVQLNAQLKNGTKPYAVRRGDNLWIISGRPEVYGNPWLWPLIWQNNLQVIPDPNRLPPGQTLKIRPNPTIQDVVNAVNYAREQIKSSDTRIGEVREQPAP